MPGNEFETVDVKQGHTQDVKAVAWHPEGEILVSCSYDDSIRLWMDDGDEWQCSQTLSGAEDPAHHTATVWAIAFRPDGGRMVSCSGDLTLMVWSTDLNERRKPEWRHVSTVSGCHTRVIYSVDWSKDNVIATSSGDNSIRLFKEETEGDLTRYPMVFVASNAHAGDVNAIRFNPADPSLLASAGDDGEVRLWRIEARTQ